MIGQMFVEQSRILPKRLDPQEELPTLEAEHLSVVFPNGNGGLHAINDISFSVHQQEFVCILGPSGSGKSTLLKVIAGLIKPTTGRVLFSGQELARPRIGFVFQQANLMPWRSVLDNILLPLELEHHPRAESIDRAMDLIHLVGLEGFEQSWPAELSGGMAQRVALARALIHDPEILLIR